MELAVPAKGGQRRLLSPLLGLVMCTPCVDELDARDAGDAHTRLVAERLTASEIPSVWRECHVSQMDLDHGRRPVVDAVMGWVREGGSLFLFGSPGTGKSRLASTAALALLTDRPLHWINAPVLFTRAEADFDSDFREKAERVLLSDTALFLDDLGKEAATQRVGQWLMAALEMRIQANQHLLITSNCQPSELGAKHGDWLASRIGAMQQWYLPGPDYRITDHA